jgi:hypothetical protein
MKISILNLIVGGIVGIIFKIIYDKLHDNREKNRIVVLIKTEMSSNIRSIKELLEEIENIQTSPDRKYLKPFDLEETAVRIEKACKNEVLNKCLDKLPLLGQKKMEKVLKFYNAFEDEAKFLRDLPRFGGNISAYSCENVTSRLLSRLEESYL